MNPIPTLAPLSSPLLAPALGGGQPVTLLGNNLSGAIAVRVGSNTIAPISTTKTSVTFKWPPNVASATPYDIAVIFPTDGDNNYGTKTNTLRAAVYYLPSSVVNAWYAAEFYSAISPMSATWTDLVNGVQVSTFNNLDAPEFEASWSNGQPALEFNGAAGLHNPSFPALSQPGAVFVVGQTGGANTNSTYFGGGWSAYQTGIGNNGSPTMNAGTALSDTLDYILRPSIAEYIFDGTTSSITVGQGTRTVGPAGSNALAGISLGIFADGSTQPLLGGFEAMVLIYNGIPTTTDENIIAAIATSIYAPVRATLAYSMKPVAPITLAQLQAAVAAVDLQEESIQTATGCTLLSDITLSSGGVVTRTIEFTLTPQFQSNFTSKTLTHALATGSWASPFNNLYTHTLGAKLGSAVQAAAPVFAQSF